MTDKGKIALIYISVALISALILATTLYIRSSQIKPELVTPEVTSLLTLEKDLTLTNQDGTEIHISDLKGKVWAFAQFYATCPMCAKRNGQGLKDLYQTFKDQSDFSLVCITVNPEEDTPEKMKSYAESLGADTSNWLFLTGDPKKLKDYMLNEMKYDPIQKREDPEEASTKGALAHNMSIAVFDRNLTMLGRRDLYHARQQGEAVYKETEKALHAIISKALDSK
jgi:cytochrome oxidase Cu insertion factor (SCO1/SenC/PrrC family)